MDKILKQAFVDAEAFEMMKSYRVEVSSIFDFVTRQDDFYITLISKMMRMMDDLELEKDSDSAHDIKQNLAEVAKGLIVYSEQSTADVFYGVNKVNNQLFVAAIYYICGYEAIASLLIRAYHIKDYETRAAQLMFYIISGCRVNPEEKEATHSVIKGFDEYLESGNTYVLEKVIDGYNTSRSNFDFTSSRDFTDTSVLLHVLRKFQQSNIWSDLKKYVPEIDWAEYVKYSKDEHILSFLPSQRDALEKGLLTFEQSFSLGLATSGGKSFITELLIFQEIKRNTRAKILYLAPLRSLSRELKLRFREMGKKLNIKCACKYGGNVADEGDATMEEAQVLISTPETFITLEGVIDEELQKFSLIICDEGQLLDDWSRGINYELLLTRLKRLDHKRFLFLSAIIPNIEDINTWLGGNENQVSKSSYRPCDLRYGIVEERDGVIDLKMWNRTLDKVSYSIPVFVERDLCRGQLGTKTGVTCMTALKALNAGPVMVYTSTKYNNAGCVKICEKLAMILKDKPDLIPIRFLSHPEFLYEIENYVGFLLGEDYPLSKYLRLGFAYHHGDLPQDIREVIENVYSRSLLPLIVSTSTLAEGVNMPIKTLVLHNILSPLSFANPRFMPRSSIKNIVGRVGRAGKHKYGVVLVPKSDKGTSEKRVLDAMRLGTLPPIKGMLYELITAMNKYNWQESNEEEINKLLETEGFADGIDLMISRNSIGQNERDISPEEVCQNSLAYKLGNEDERMMLNKVFYARYSRIISLMKNKEYDLFLETGLALSAYYKVKDAIKEENIERFYELNELNQEDFMSYIVPIVNDAKLLEDGIDSKCFILVASSFMAGITYAEIANKVGLEVKDVLKLTNCLQNQFADLVKSVFMYVKFKYGVENPFLTVFPEYLKYGISKQFEYELVTNRLTDWVLVHGFSNYVTEILKLNAVDIMCLKINKEKIISYLSGKKYPMISLKKADRWLSS